MKAILRIIWFAVAVVIQKYVLMPLSDTKITDLSNKLNSYSPVNLSKYGIDLVHIYNREFVAAVLFLIILFLGLDIISGDIKGIIKGPLKLVFNAVLYLIGFSILVYALASVAGGFPITLIQ